MSHKIVTVQGNTSPDLAITLWREGQPINLTGVTAVILILTGSTGSVTNTGHQTCTVTDATGGKISYSVTTGDFATAGNYSGEVQVTFASGKVEKIYETFSVKAR